jgi:hypothetical protein
VFIPSVAIGDLNGDGELDIASTNYIENSFNRTGDASGAAAPEAEHDRQPARGTPSPGG